MRKPTAGCSGLQVEDRIGSRLPDGQDVTDVEEEIDLETFEEQFILPAHIAVDVSLEPTIRRLKRDLQVCSSIC